MTRNAARATKKASTQAAAPGTLGPERRSSEIFCPQTSFMLAQWSSRGLEFLWLAAILLIPLVAVSRGYLVSEVVTSEAALLKIATLRIVVALMVILWMVEWSLSRQWTITSPFSNTRLNLNPALHVSRMVDWLKQQPTRWLTLAVIFTTASLILTTVLSASLTVSLWGAIPGQDGYSAYTLISYIILFAVIATHLRTPAQLWRLLGVVVLMGVLFGAFGVIQHYADDPFALLETPGQVRVSSTAGNPIFAASVLLMTIGVSLMLATTKLRGPLNTSRYWARMGLWVLVLGVQGLAIMFTLSRGPWLGTILSVGMFLALVAAFLGRRVLLRAGLIVVLTGALMAAFVWTIDPLLRPSETKDKTGDTVIDRFGTITGQAGGGSMQDRLEIWETSWRLATTHTWTESDPLSLRWLRVLIGYGPDLYRYAYLMESLPRGEDLDIMEAHNAHNYYINQTVEQGILGLVSSLAVVVAAVAVGGYLLIWRGEEYPPVYKLVLIGLICLVAGRALEQMVGVGRVSDLTISWVLLGAFAALPMIALNSRPAVQDTISKPRSQRSSFPKSRPEPTSWARRAVWITLIASLTLGIGLLTWLKTVNYPLAAREVAIGRDLFSQGPSQASLESFERAIDLAPDVPPYYRYRATVYSEYMQRYEEGSGDREAECAFQESATGNSYIDCLAEKVYLVGSEAISRNPLYLRSYSYLAETALNRSLASPDNYPPEEAIGLYREAHRLSPNNWRYLNKLAFAYIRSDEPEKAKPFIDRSLEITGDNPKSAYGLYLKGAAYINTGEMQVGADYIEQALALDGTNNWAGQAHESLAQVYARMGSMDLAAEHRSASQQLSIG